MQSTQSSQITKPQTMTRRDMLRHASVTTGAVIATAGLPGTLKGDEVMRVMDAPETGSVAKTHADAALFAYAPRIRALDESVKEAIRTYQDIEEAAWAAHPPKPTATYRIGPGDIIVDESGKVPTIRFSDDYNGQIEAAERETVAWKLECERVDQEHGLNEADAQARELQSQLAELVEEMLAIPAGTIEGVRFKIEVAKAVGELMDAADVIAADIASLVPRSVWTECASRAA